MPNIVVLILYTEAWQQLADIVIPNAKYYCIMHGYNFVVKKYPEPYLSDFGYKKLEQILELFEDKEVEAVMSMDLDCLITNHKKQIEPILEEKYHFYISKDYNGTNAGVFICRNTEYCIWFLTETLKLKGEPKMYCEQDAFSEMIKRLNMFADKICFTQQKAINAYKYELYPDIPPQTEEQGQWIEGKSFILHLPGLGYGNRLDILRNTKITL